MSGPRTAARAAALLLALGALACKGRPAAPILTWHEIGPAGGAAPPAEADGWRVPEPLFLAQLDALRGAGFATVPLGALLDHADRGALLPPRAIVLTFDDGTEDHLTRVLPALQARGMRGAFFVVAGRIAPGAEQRQAEQTAAGERRYLTWPEVRRLRDAGMEVGAHGLTHARLPELTDEAALDELVRARALIGQALGAPPELLAWPFNAVRARHRELARQAGYRAAVAGVAHGSADRYSLYRTPVTAATAPAALLASLR